MEQQPLQASINYFLTLLGLVSFCIGALAVGWVVWRLKSDETWKRVAEQRKERVADLEKELERVKGRLTRSDDDCERFEQRYFRELAKNEWYEKRHGPIPPDAL